MDNFTEHFARMSANVGDDLDEEYSVRWGGWEKGECERCVVCPMMRVCVCLQDLEPDFAQTSYAAKLSINRNKNRYINIIPCKPLTPAL